VQKHIVKVSLTQIKAELSKYVNRAAYGNERVIITSRGRPKAALLSIQELERLDALEDALAAQEAVAAWRAGETEDWEQVKVELAGAGNGVQD